MRRMGDRTFIGGTPPYSRFQRGGRVCGRAQGRPCTQRGGRPCMAGHGCLEADNRRQEVFGPDSHIQLRPMCLRPIPAVMSVEIHEVTAVHRSPSTSTGRGWERHMGVSDRLAPGCAHAPAMRWHAPALVLSMTRGHRQFLLVAPSHADNTLVENAPRPGSSRIQDIDSSVTWVDKPVSHVPHTNSRS